MQGTKSPWVDFKAIKSQISIAQIFQRYGILESLAKTGNGDRLSGACPIHGGSNKTHFRASISKNCWNCFGKCQSGGNVIDFVAKKENVSFRDAAILIQEWFGVSKEVAVSCPEAVRNQPQISEVAPTPRIEPVAEESGTKEIETATENKPLKFSLKNLDPSHSYLRERGLADETIATFGLGYCGKGLMQGYVAIPIHNGQGELVAYAGRWPGTPPEGTAKYKLPNGFKKSLELFNLHRALLSQQATPLVIVEGFFDCIKVHQAGYERVVALMGSSLSEAQERLIMEFAGCQGSVAILLDNDEAGRKAQPEIVHRLARHCFVKSLSAPAEGMQPEHLVPEDLRHLLPTVKNQ
jgi:DNA primase